MAQINIDIRIDNKRKIGKIEEVTLEESSLKPGDSLIAQIKIRPFRGDLIEKTLTIQLPSHVSSGEALLMVSGGGDLNNQQEELVNGGEKVYKNLEEIFKDITDRPRGNQIIGEVIIYSDEFTSEEETGEDDLKENEEKKDLLISKIETDMVIEGYLEVSFTILED